MTHVTCRLTAKNRDQLRNPTFINRVWATFLSAVAVEDGERHLLSSRGVCLLKVGKTICIAWCQFHAELWISQQYQCNTINIQPCWCHAIRQQVRFCIHSHQKHYSRSYDFNEQQNYSIGSLFTATRVYVFSYCRLCMNSLRVILFMFVLFHNMRVIVIFWRLFYAGKDQSHDSWHHHVDCCYVVILGFAFLWWPR